MPTELQLHGFTAATLHSQIADLTQNLVNISDTSGKFLLHLPDGRVIDTKGWNDWEWTHGIALYGLYRYYQQTSSQDVLSIIESWFAARLAEGTTKNINTMCAMLTLAYLYDEQQQHRQNQWAKNKMWRATLNAWADWAMHDLARTPYGGFQHVTYSQENVNELWDDTLMMTVLPLAKIGLVLEQPAYVDEAKRQFLLHITYLFDATTGLFFHGWKFNDAESGGDGGHQSSALVGHHFARARWARGNSWLTMAIPEFVELLDLAPGDSLRLHLLSILEAQCAALKRLQDSKSDMWRTLLDKSEEEGSYVEASATAGFAYGMLKAVRKRYIAHEYREVAIKAVKAVVQRIDVSGGELTDVSFGTPVFDTLQGYMDVPRTSMPYGQSMAILALNEMLYLFI